ncbi:AIG_G0025640.mRNA.1.CDS.1 [Saccharomyces cerevisiae]|nr:AIG_G0025640.mRNA.1.CDS.1 [Saccharomyces cerevisiae]CAI6595669.1 AIG_G0025640.mRNA.1.CDS.1 [Saccharomyces cerevisiae]
MTARVEVDVRECVGVWVWCVGVCGCGVCGCGGCGVWVWCGCGVVCGCGVWGVGVVCGCGGVWVFQENIHEAAEQRTESWFSPTKQIVKILCTMEIEKRNSSLIITFLDDDKTETGQSFEYIDGFLVKKA